MALQQQSQVLGEFRWINILMTKSHKRIMVSEKNVGTTATQAQPKMELTPTEPKRCKSERHTKQCPNSQGYNLTEARTFAEQLTFKPLRINKTLRSQQK